MLFYLENPQTPRKRLRYERQGLQGTRQPLMIRIGQAEHLLLFQLSSLTELIKMKRSECDRSYFIYMCVCVYICVSVYIYIYTHTQYSNDDKANEFLLMVS